MIDVDYFSSLIAEFSIPIPYMYAHTLRTDTRKDHTHTTPTHMNVYSSFRGEEMEWRC